MTVHIPMSSYFKMHKCMYRVKGRMTRSDNIERIHFKCEDPYCEREGLAEPWVFTGGKPAPQPHIFLGGRWVDIDEALESARVRGADGEWRRMTREELIKEVTRIFQNR